MNPTIIFLFSLFLTLIAINYMVQEITMKRYFIRKGIYDLWSRIIGSYVLSMIAAVLEFPYAMTWIARNFF